VLADAPDGVKRLRELVLSLAVRGQLVAQDPEDQPADVLLERIAQEKARLVKEKKIRKPKKLPPLVRESLPFALPTGWVWSRVEHFVQEVTDGVHKTPVYVDSGVPFLSIKDISSGFMDFRNTRFISDEAHWEMTRRCRPQRGDILFCRIGTLGRALVVDTDREFSIFVSLGLLKMTGHLDARYIQHVLNSPESYSQYDRIKAGGSHTNKLNLGAMRGAVMPIAPLAEQRRIVARVDELMGLLDRLEAARTHRDDVRTKARDAALADLRDAPDTEAVEAAWGRIARQMDDLFTTPDDVAPLRQAILQLAVRGRLVPATCMEVGLSDLLRERLSNGRSVPTGQGYPVLRLTALRGQSVDSQHSKNGAWSAEDGRRFRIEAGDLLVVRGNGSKDLVARGCMVLETEEVAFPDTAIRLRPDLNRVSQKYLFYAWEAPSSRAFLEEKAKTTAGIWKVSQADLYDVTLPVPDLAAQERIVAKVDALMAICDRLESRLTTAVELHAQFAAAAVHHLDAAP
jgi:type I restriction enzyme S subunit